MALGDMHNKNNQITRSIKVLSPGGQSSELDFVELLLGIV